jgi:putative inorganic carbon (HCO3(-)) transporter
MAVRGKSIRPWLGERGLASRRFGPYGKLMTGVATWIVEHELWLLLIVTFLLAYPGPFTPVGLVFVPLPWLCRRMVRGHFTVSTGSEWPILALLLMAVVGLYPSINLQASVVILCQLVAGVSLFYGLVNWADSEERLWLVSALLVLIGLGLTLIAPLGTEWNVNKLSVFAWPEVYEGFTLTWLPEVIHPNILAGALCPLIPVVLALLSSRLTLLTREEGRLARLFLALTLGLMLAMVLLTQSRGAYLALAVGLVVLGCLRYRWFLATVPILLLESVAILRRLGVGPVADFILSNATLGSLAGRQEVWRRAVYMLRDFPCSGIGLGTFGQIGPLMYPYFIQDNPAVPHAHNLFLQIGVDVGLLGLLAYIALLAAGFSVAWRAYRLSAGPDLSVLSAGLLAGLTVLIVHGLIDATTWGTKTAFIPWLILGLAAALGRNLKR